MLWAVHHQVMMHMGSLEITQEEKSCSQRHLKQLLDFFHVLQTSRVRYYSIKHAEASMHCLVRHNILIRNC